MLHHIPSLENQDRAFAEIARVLRPGGTFAGTDSLSSGVVFKLIHVGDTLNLIDPDTLPGRLQNAGMDCPRSRSADGRSAGARPSHDSGAAARGGRSSAL